MKIAGLLPLFMSFSAAAASLDWQDLAVDDRLALTQTLDLDGKSGGTIRVANGGEYVLESIEALPGLSVVDLIFRARRCRHPEVESALTMILPLENGRNSKAEVGVFFLRKCSLEILVEAKDFGRASFFRK